ncbi:MAG: hypothetical protein WBN77_11650 [Desulfobacterales bacterium]
MKKHFGLSFLFFVMCTALIVNFMGCSNNIKNIKAPEQPVSKTQTFSAPFEKVWNTAQRALSEEDTFKVLDKSSGIMVTEFRTIDGKELTLFQMGFLGKTYKRSYTVNFIKDGSKTDVCVNVKLQALQSALLLSREESNENVEAYLRKKLFDKITASLR